MKIPRIVLTGGPCAGKTTALAYLQEKLSDRGYYPLIVPEAPTLLMLGNLSPTGGAFSQSAFQTRVVNTMQKLEDEFLAAAKDCLHPKPVLIFDRGITDASAYMPSTLYNRIVTSAGLGTPLQVRDGRYDAVIHLRSAAVGAEEFYTTANNAVRRETVQQARVRDKETLDSWVGHPHLRVVDNSTDFAGKLRRIDQELCSFLGIPVPLEIENKYRCGPVRYADIPVRCERIDIEQVYLYSPEPDKVVRVRKRGQHDSYVYYRTEKRILRPGVNVETESLITAEEYAWSLTFRQPDRQPIRKERWCFVWEEQYFELDLIPRNDGMLYLLEVELTQEGQQPKLPGFLKVLEEVTGDPAYSNYELAAAA